MVKLDDRTKEIATDCMESLFDPTKLSTADYRKEVMNVLSDYGIVLH